MILPPYRLLAVGLVAVALYIGGVFSGWYARGVVVGKAMADLITQHTQALADLDRRAAETMADYRATEARRAAMHQEITDAAILQAKRQAADARRAAATADSLRRAAHALAASSGGASDDPATATSCTAASAGAFVLADVLGLVEQRGREMAQLADERGTGWAACQRAYEALNEKATP